MAGRAALPYGVFVAKVGFYDHATCLVYVRSGFLAGKMLWWLYLVSKGSSGMVVALDDTVLAVEFHIYVLKPRRGCAVGCSQQISGCRCGGAM